MKLLIDIDEDSYNRIKDGNALMNDLDALWTSTKNGKPYEETNLLEYISLYKKKEEFYKSQGQDVTAREMGFVAELLHEIKSEQRPQGEWICKGTEEGAFGIRYEIKQCNKCGFEHSLCIPRNFCPNCGATMGTTL